jgi:hypothetical protein
VEKYVNPLLAEGVEKYDNPLLAEGVEKYDTCVYDNPCFLKLNMKADQQCLKEDQDQMSEGLQIIAG